MGNCQAVDAAALVIQHPNGKQERMYWPLTANEVMKMNPGHYVSLIIPLPEEAAAYSNGGQENNNNNNNSDDKSKTIRFTRVKLLRPSDTLVLGRAYRLVTTQEVMKVLRAKKHAKMKKIQSESGENLESDSEELSTSSRCEPGKSAVPKQSQATSRHQQRSGSTNLASGRHKNWRPSLNSISESPSRDRSNITSSTPLIAKP